MAEDSREGEKMAPTEAVVKELPKETLDYFNGDEIRARVFHEKYANKDMTGAVTEKTPVEMWERVAREIASMETDPVKKDDWKGKFLWLMEDFKFIPGGRIMFGVGQKRKNTLLNCYVIPIKEDSIEAIWDFCKEAARTYSLGGGVGTDISVLRPRGTAVNNAAISSTGSVSFMELMSETTHVIGQSGRRGAMMITISVDHPDILDFIRVKQNLTKVRYANISVRVTDEFMRAVESDSEFMLRFGNDIVHRVERKVRAKEVWDELVKAARDWAEPGIMFWDVIKQGSPSEYNGMGVVTTNPCAEEPLEPYGACDLGNLNLSQFVIDPFKDNARVDWDTMEKATRYAVRFLDDVLDYSADRHPLKQQAEEAGKTRRIGLGFTGLADIFVKLRIKYDSDQALEFADKLFENIKNWAYDASSEIAKEKGSFPLFDREKHLSMPFVKRVSEKVREKIAAQGLRNVALLTAPPVGSGSVLAGTSSGIEPIYAFSYTRRSESLSQEYFKIYQPVVMDYMRMVGMSSESDLPDFFVPAHKIEPSFRVRMQSTIQRHIDGAISSTVNLPADATAERVGEIYMEAWKAGCKSITVYREGSREGVLITDDEKRRKAAQSNAESEWNRPQAMIGKTIKLMLPQGSLYITANFDEERNLREVFINMGRGGSQEKSYCEAMGRIISRYLQAGGDVKNVIDSLKNIRANDSISWYMGIKLYSVPDAIAKSLEIATGAVTLKAKPLASKEQPKAPEEGHDAYTDGVQTGVKEGEWANKPDPCPQCGERTLVNENGCYTCKACGYTKCS